jgi:hypothetical protein
MKTNPIVVSLATCSVLVFLLVPRATFGQEIVTTEPPVRESAPPPPAEPCPKGHRGGAIAGIVVASVFFGLLPMSIPVLVTQGKKLKAHNKAMREHRCQYAPGS